MTSDGLCIGTNDACNLAAVQARLADARARTVAEHAARALDAA